MANSATRFIISTYRQPYMSLEPKSDLIKGEIPSNESADVYKKFIWDLARKFTGSVEEAEAAVRQMEADISRCAENGVVVTTNEERVVAAIAWRRLKKFLG